MRIFLTVIISLLSFGIGVAYNAHPALIEPKSKTLWVHPLELSTRSWVNSKDRVYPVMIYGKGKIDSKGTIHLEKGIKQNDFVLEVLKTFAVTQTQNRGRCNYYWTEEQ
jgi:hypothetical protein